MVSAVDAAMTEWKQSFAVFGFTVLRNTFSQAEMDAFTHAAEALLNVDRAGLVFSGEDRQQVYGFVERSSILQRLLVDDRIYLTVQALLGEGVVWLGSDGNLYVGSTGWHCDGSNMTYRRIKVIFYLDTLTSDNGALRVIPGSHKEPLHSELLPLLGRSDERVTPFGVRAPKRERVNDSGFAVRPEEVPAVSLATSPGDVVMIDQNLWHSSFGGGSGRRMFSLSFGEGPSTPEQLELIRAIYCGQLDHVQHRQLTPQPVLYGDRFLQSEDPRVVGMLDPQRRLGLR